MLNRVAERENDSSPSDKQTDDGSLEAGVCCGGDGLLDGLLRGALQFDRAPVPWDNEEEVL